MVKRPHQRVAVFIDTQNMYHSAKHIYGARVNFGALVDAAVANRPVVRAIAYVAKSKTGEEHGFFEALVQHGIELKVKDVQEFASGEKKADWDVGMAVDAMAIAISGRVDVVVLVTGDGDFCPLADYLRANGILCEVVAFGSSTNAQLKERADSFLDLSSDPTAYLIHSARAGRSVRHTNTHHIAPAMTMPVQEHPVPESLAPLTLDVAPIERPRPVNPPTDSSTLPRGRGKTRGRPSGEDKPSDEPPQPTRKIRVTF
ncbi:NYN domain-containing protein [Patescibacteria group bacterium]|nr:NYN domain-containing protein [Patescibacteria group bacterium]